MHGVRYPFCSLSQAWTVIAKRKTELPYTDWWLSQDANTFLEEAQ